MTGTSVNEPFPIFRVAQNHFLYEIDIITHVRREHHICGVLIGNIPQATQQTVFSGIPLELMPEEARLLVQKGCAFVVDDVAAHRHNLINLPEEAKSGYRDSLLEEGTRAAEAIKLHALEKKEAHFRKSGSKAESLAVNAPQPMQVTPTSSYPPLELSEATKVSQLPQVPTSYPVFAHLHGNGYFLGPGLRFGCQYVAYPGDPLRYHSHFLVVGHEWDEEIDLLDIVGGGRLGTAVKKGYMIGGAESQEDETKEGNVRTFSFEWAAM